MVDYSKGGLSVRLTKHNGRKNKSGVYRVKHNDRNFDVDKAEHIDKTKSDENIYWHCYGEEKLTFEQAELKFYKENFGDMLEAKNARYIKQRHPERVQSMEKMIKNEKFCPEETLFYIGKKDDTVDKETLTTVFNEYLDWHEKEYSNIKVLNWAFHGDEKGASHIHERHVWTATDNDGNLTIGQNKALKEMGIERPDITKPEGRKNNAKMTYTADTRKKLFEICKKHGLELIEEPQEASESGLSLTEYKKRQEEKKLEKMQEKTADLAKKIALTKNDDSSLESAKNQAEIKKKTLSRQEYVELPVQAYNTIVSIAEHGINGNLANLSLKDDNDKLKRENAGLKATVDGAEQKALDRFGAENKRLRERNAELTQKSVTLKSQAKALEQVKKNADQMQKFIKNTGKSKEFASFSKSASKPTRTASKGR